MCGNIFWSHINCCEGIVAFYRLQAIFVMPTCTCLHLHFQLKYVAIYVNLYDLNV